MVDSMRCMRARLRWIKSQRGQAMWELAWGIVLLFFFLLGIIECAKILYIYQNLLTSVRMGARYLASHPYNPGHIERAKNLVVYGKTSAGGTPQAPKLTTANVLIDPIPNSTN